MNKKVFLYLMNQKGLASLERIISCFGAGLIEGAHVDFDKATASDYSEEITNLLTLNGISFCSRTDNSLSPSTETLKIAIGWRRLIKDNRNLVIFHDSLLPRLRGFNPLVTAMLNRDSTTGVTALWASEFPDHGPIISQEALKLEYPSSIHQNIEKISILYANMVERILKMYLSSEPLPFSVQDDNSATYSLWRDDEDYLIDWNESATEIAHKVLCLGFPYLGAKTSLNGASLRIQKAKALKDLNIENRAPGKIFGFDSSRNPIVVCGKGLLSLEEVYDEQGLRATISHMRSRLK